MLSRLSLILEAAFLLAEIQKNEMVLPGKRTFCLLFRKTRELVLTPYRGWKDCSAPVLDRSQMRTNDVGDNVDHNGCKTENC